MRVRLAVAAAITLSLVVATGCSIGGQGSATRVRSGDVPFNLLDETTTVPPGTIATATTLSDVNEIYLVRDDRLRAVERPEDALDADTVLALLASGPTEDEIVAGIRTALVPDLAEVTGATGDVTIVDLTEEFSSLAPIEQRLALAQITFTLTQLPAVSAVRFLVAGEDASVPRGDGSTVERPVTQQDYEDLSAP